MSDYKGAVITAMRADSIPAATRGLWEVRKLDLAAELRAPPERWGGAPRITPKGKYTALIRHTMATMHQGGEVVMNDFPQELGTHLGFALNAYGRVLVTGLGLGCVLRGLLENPMVEHIDVVERDKDVVSMVWEHMPWKERMTLHVCDAVAFVKSEHGQEWDCAWHDLWSDVDAGEKNLTAVHTRLMVELSAKKAVAHQGAWAYPRALVDSIKRHSNWWIG